jgi:hypothetical protein
MATTYTLDEAAAKLGIKPEELKKKLQTEWSHVRPMRDRGTILLKAKDVEELHRQMGFGSEEELQLADPSSSERSVPEEMIAADDAPKPSNMPSGRGGPAKARDDAPLPLADDALMLGEKDVFLLSDEPAKAPGGSKKTAAPAGSDSDVRLEKSGKIKPVKRPDEGSGTEEIELDVLPPTTSPSGKLSGSGKITSSKSGKLPKVTGTKSGQIPPAPAAEEDSSEFELSLDPGSSDEFELSLAPDSSDEISLGDMPTSSPSGKGGQSGINLGKPADSGVSLEKKGGGSSGKLKGGGSSGKLKGGDSGSRKSGKIQPVKADSDEDIDFELSLDQPGASSKKIAGGSSKKKVDSDSEFELTLDEGAGVNLDAETASFEAVAEEESKGDIFETDFEIPALDDDSASEAVALDEADTDLDSSSDFDLAIDEADVSVEDESASQVVVLDDETGEDEEKPKAKKGGKKPLAAPKGKPKPATKKKAAVEVEDEDVVVEEGAVDFDEMEIDESESASKALKGAKAEADEEEEEKGGTVIINQSAPWPAWPAVLMLIPVFVMFLGGIMAYELVHSMWGYHQPTKPASLVVENVAKTLDLGPKE